MSYTPETPFCSSIFFALHTTTFPRFWVIHNVYCSSSAQKHFSTRATRCRAFARAWLKRAAAFKAIFWRYGWCRNCKWVAKLIIFGPNTWKGRGIHTQYRYFSHVIDCNYIQKLLLRGNSVIWSSILTWTQNTGDNCMTHFKFLGIALVYIDMRAELMHSCWGGTRLRKFKNLRVLKQGYRILSFVKIKYSINGPICVEWKE